MRPTTQYAKGGKVSIAYQVTGNGPVDLVYVPGWVSNINLMWEDPILSEFLIKLTDFTRLILFDKRGTGLSDRFNEVSSLEERMDDIRCVMDAANSEKAIIFGHSEGGSVSALFAATYPERTLALVTFGIFAKRKYSDDYPWAPNDEEREIFYRTIIDGWGNPEKMRLEWIMPSMVAHKNYLEWFARYLSSSASPGAAIALARMNTVADITNILSTIKVPVLIINRIGDKDVKVEEARFINEHIPNSKLVELPGDDHLFWIGDWRSVMAEIEEFVTGVRPTEIYDRVLATILFTDIVSSTHQLYKKGDKDWVQILRQHNKIVRREIRRFEGKEIKNTGDGFLATFNGPSKAIRCAKSIKQHLEIIDIEITASIHTGECEIHDKSDIGGLAVHVAARVLGQAKPSQILITMTVMYLLGGTGLKFDDLGDFCLKGIDDKYRLFALKE